MSGSFADSAAIETGEFVDFLEFRLAGRRYSIELGRVWQGQRHPVVTRIPRSPAVIRGTTMLAGDIVVVVDPYAVFDIERPFEADSEGELVVLDPEQTPQPIGLLVETVDGIERHAVDAVSPIRDGEALAPIDGRWFRAVLDPASPDDDPVPVLDLGRFVSEVTSLC